VASKQNWFLAVGLKLLVFSHGSETARNKVFFIMYVYFRIFQAGETEHSSVKAFSQHWLKDIPLIAPV